MEILNQLKGLQVVDVVASGPDDFAILFDDGIIYQTGQSGDGFYQGTGWEGLWNLLQINYGDN